MVSGSGRDNACDVVDYIFFQNAHGLITITSCLFSAYIHPGRRVLILRHEGCVAHTNSDGTHTSGHILTPKIVG